MSPQPSTERRSEKIDFRISPNAKAKLQAAAAASGCSVSDFIATSAIARAEETLADRTAFHLSTEAWRAFQAALDAPPRPMPRMQALLNEPGYFDKAEK